MILGICGEPDILKVVMLVKTVIGFIRVAVPIVLIVTMMITYAQAVAKNEAVSKTNMFFVYRGIAAAVIFLVPTIVVALLNLVGANDKEFKDCMDFSTPTGISNAYVTKANNYVANVRNTLSSGDYFNAVNAVNKIDNIEEKNALNSELAELKTYVDLKSEIDGLLNDYSYKKFSDIKKKIEAVEDTEIKNILMTRFDEVKESLFAFIGDYPIVPFGEHELYTGLKYFKYDTLSNLLEKNGSSVEELNEKIQMAVEFYGVGTRKATVAAAITLIGSVAETGYQLPYYWGGKRDKLGVDGTWGTFKDNPWCNDYYFDTQDRIDYCKQQMSYWAMDCSGFVNWAIVQGTRVEKWQTETNQGTKIKLGSNTADKAVCEIGDALETVGHIVLVVGLDDENKRYIIAEESLGLEIDDLPYDGLNGSYWCEKLDHNYVD